MLICLLISDRVMHMYVSYSHNDWFMPVNLATINTRCCFHRGPHGGMTGYPPTHEQTQWYKQTTPTPHPPITTTTNKNCFHILNPVPNCFNFSKFFCNQEHFIILVPSFLIIIIQKRILCKQWLHAVGIQHMSPAAAARGCFFPIPRKHLYAFYCTLSNKEVEMLWD